MRRKKTFKKTLFLKFLIFAKYGPDKGDGDGDGENFNIEIWDGSR